MPSSLRVPGFPFEVAWRGGPAAAYHLGEDDLTITAPAGTDLFDDPGSDEEQHDAPMLIGPVTGDFRFACRVSSELATTFDAGALVVWADEQHWAKLALERSPEGEGMIVSVVSRGRSDDANGWVVGDRVWLRVARIGPAFAFHASDDGGTWRLARHFALTSATRVEVGFLSQSPNGTGCQSNFDHVRFDAATLSDLRDGS